MNSTARLAATLWATLRVVRASAGRELASIFTLQLLAAGALLGQLFLGKQLLDGVTGSGGPASVGNLAGVLVGLGICTAVAAGASVAVLEFQRILMELVQRHLEEQIIQVVVGVDMKRLDDPDFHDRHQRAMTAFVDRPYDMVNGVVSVVGSIIGVAAMAAVLIPLTPWLLPVALLAAAPLAWITSRTTRDLYARFRNMATLDRRRAYLGEMLTSPRAAGEIRLFNAEAYFLPRFRLLYEERIRRVRALARSRMRTLVIVQLLAATVGVALIAVLVHMTSTGQLSVSELGVAAVAVQQLMQRLRLANSGIVSLHESSLFLGDLTSFLETPRMPTRADDDVTTRAAQTALEAQNVTFVYPGTERMVLQNVSLQIPAGKIVALVGSNGAGKTTLLKLLCGLYSPTSGVIGSRDDDVMKPLDQPHLHNQVTGVFQDFGRYALTARDNIVMADHTSADDELLLRRAADQAGILSLIDGLPGGFDTMLSREYDGGTDLSVGQWQRIALARAFFRTAPFVLLDEPTAAADAANELRFFDELRKSCRNRGVLLISHKLTTARRADMIYVLEGGRVVESGHHVELVAAGGMYAAMHELQGE